MQPQPQRIRNSNSGWNRFLVLVSVVAWVTIVSAVAWGQSAPEIDATRAKAAKPNATEGQKWALLIGVDHYLDPRLGNLRFCGADVRALRDVLVRQGGFPADQVIVLHDQEKEPVRQPLRLSIERSLKSLLAQAGPQDLVLVSFSGHGIQVGETAYLCPTEADLDKPEATMVSVASLYEKLSKECRAAQKIVFVDACRKPVESGQKAPALELTKGFSDRLRQVPEGLLILSSCKAGQLSYEEKEFGHGVFAHYLLDGLTGKADARGPNLRGNADGRIDVDELFNYASTQTGKYVMNRFVEAQTPELYGVRRGPIDLLAALPDVHEILDKALRASRSIVDAKKRAASLRAIVRVQATVGAFDDALDSARLISLESEESAWFSGPYSTRFLALTSIAGFQTQAGNRQGALATLTEAHNVARSIADGSQKRDALKMLAGAFANAGDLSNALQTARSIDDGSTANKYPWLIQHDKLSAFESVLSTQAKTGDRQTLRVTLREALDVARICDVGPIGMFRRSRSQALKDFALLLANLGETEMSRTTLQEALQAAYLLKEEDRVAALKDIAAIQSKLGDIASARLTLRDAVKQARLISEEVEKAWCLNDVASAQAEVNDTEAGRATRRETLAIVHSFGSASTDNPSFKIRTLMRIALGQANDGDKPAAKITLENALRAARSLNDDNAKWSALCDVVQAQIEVGAIASALLTARSMGDVEGKGSPLTMIVDAQAKAGDFVSALQTARSIGDESSRVQSLLNIAEAHAKAGDKQAARMVFADALQMARSIKDESQTASAAMSTVAESRAKAGDFVSALETARFISDKNWAAYTLAGIAATQADAGDSTSAKATIREALVITEELIQQGNDESTFVACSWVAIAQARSGLASEAMVTVRDVLLPRWPKDGIGEYGETSAASFVSAQLKNGGATQVYHMASSIPNASDQVFILLCLAEAILEQQKPAVSKSSSDPNQPAK